MRNVRSVIWVMVMLSATASGAIRVASVRGWSSGSQSAQGMLSKLEADWSQYGSIAITTDISLHTTDHFTYEDLVATGADVVWLSDPAGYNQQFSADEIAAVERYANEGHSVIGTYAVFQHRDTDNRALAPLFGLRSDIGYVTDFTNGVEYDNSAEGSFDLIKNHPLFYNVDDPLVNNGHMYAHLPQDDLSWEDEDLAGAEILAVTSDNRGIITWYQTDEYHAIYVSEMLEYDLSIDPQFFYNAFTIPEPCSLVLLGLGGLVLRRKCRR